MAAECTGHPYDAVLGIYFAQARMYDARDKRFMAVDIIVGMQLTPNLSADTSMSSTGF